MKIKFGKSIIDGADSPIAIFLTAEERKKIADMPDDMVIYCDYPEGQYTEEEINKWLGVRDVAQSPDVTDSGDIDPNAALIPFCVGCESQIIDDDVVGMTKDGNLVHFQCNRGSQIIGTYHGGRVSMF